MNDREKFCVLYAGGRMLVSEELENGMPQELAEITFEDYMAGLCKRYGLEELCNDKNLLKEINMFIEDVGRFCEAETEGKLSK